VEVLQVGEAELAHGADADDAAGHAHGAALGQGGGGGEVVRGGEAVRVGVNALLGERGLLVDAGLTEIFEHGDLGGGRS